MSNLKRVSLLTVVALAVVAYAAVPASADILSPSEFGLVYSDCDPGGDPEDCPVKGERTGAAPTFTAGGTVVTCQTAGFEGLMDGDWTAAGPASAELNFSWGSCTTQGSVPCSVNAITGVSFEITEENAPSFTFRNTETAATTITCAFNSCTWSSNPATTPLTIEVDHATQVATINDTMDVSGSIGCSPSGVGTYSAQYLITDDQDQDLGLYATGTLLSEG